MKYKISDLVEKIVDNRGKTPPCVESGIPLIEINSITEDKVHPNYGVVKKYITKDVYESLRAGGLKKNDILVGTVGTLGTIALMDDNTAAIAQNLIALRTKDSVNPIWLYYALKYHMKEILSLDIGGVQPSIKVPHLLKFAIDVPTFEQQNKIANILSAIDEKIELNDITNQTIHNIMKEYFDYQMDIIENFSISSLSEIATYKNGLAMQKNRPENEEGLPVIKIKEMNEGITSATERCSSSISDDVIINDGDVLFAWSGTLCMTIWCGGKAGLNQHIFKVTSDKYPKWFYYFWTLRHLNNFIQIAAGKATTMGHIKRGELDIAKVKVPDELTLTSMNNILEPLLNLFIKNKIMNNNFILLREMLLTELLSGKINLDGIEV